MTLAEIYRPIQSQLQATETLILKELTLGNNFRHGLMREMTQHVAGMSGKRIRPALGLLAARVVHSSSQNGSASFSFDAVRLAASVEMIHTATLLHDDVIDGATLRRGLTTLNAKWGDTLSVLSGDYLYSKAFCLLSELKNPLVLRLMADTARQVCEGEVAQIQHQYDLALRRSTYLKFIEWKTASLMGAAAEAGALIGGASAAQAKHLGTFGLSFGLAFQILDDTQDLVGDQEALGKSLGTDLALGQLTLPLLYLRDVAHSSLRTSLTEWFTGNGSRTSAQARAQLDYLREEAIRYKVPAYCTRVAGQYLHRARQALNPFPSSLAKTSFLALADFLLQ